MRNEEKYILKVVKDSKKLLERFSADEIEPNPKLGIKFWEREWRRILKNYESLEEHAKNNGLYCIIDSEHDKTLIFQKIGKEKI